MSVSFCTPWRSVWLPRAITAVALIVGLPLFLRSPPWCDITLYQMAARNILHGGVHYRDLFDTNLPGFVWAMTALYSVFGPNVVVVRVVDLFVVLGVVLLIDRVAKWGGATTAGRWWAIAGAAVFYPFTVEMSHAQRDTWMTLPALAAVALRVRRGIAREEPPPSPLGSPSGPQEVPPTVLKRGNWRGLVTGAFRPSFYEGLLWGAAVWMKPHIALMALTVWLLTVRRLAGGHARPWRAAAADLLGNLLGGATVGAAGVVWMFASGAWNEFVTVFSVWNPRYVKLAQNEFCWRVNDQLYWFPPWSLWLIVTVPIAFLSVLDMAPWQGRARATASPTGWLGRWLPRHLWDKRADADARFVRGTLGGLYVAWAAQAFLVQRGFQYAHLPETLLMLGVWATHRWAWVPVVFVWLAVTGGVWLIADHSPAVKNGLDGLTAETRRRYLPRHTLADPGRLKLWPQCWRFGQSDAERYALWDDLRLHPPHEASIGWSELNEVAQFLRAAPRGDGGTGVRHHEVVAWFDSPHAVYLMLDLAPGFRYMHVYTAIAISVGEDVTGALGRTEVLKELCKTQERQGVKYRYVVSDLEWTALSAGDDPVVRALFVGPARNPPSDLLPATVPYPNEFPWNQPTVFRTRNGTGRYIVHRVVTVGDGPNLEVFVPHWWGTVGCLCALLER